MGKFPVNHAGCTVRLRGIIVGAVALAFNQIVAINQSQGSNTKSLVKGIEDGSP